MSLTVLSSMVDNTPCQKRVMAVRYDIACYQTNSKPRLMRIVRITWLALFLGISVTYWLSLNSVELTMQPWALRKSLLYYSGVIAIGMMSIGMVLAMRLHAIERWLGGLDTHYRLHKWLGITAVIAAVVHYLVKLEPKWLVKQGWVEAATFKTPAGTVGFFDHADPFNALRSIAKDVGEWAIYALVILAVIALAKRLPYRRFLQTHRLMALIYLALAFHSVVLFSKLGWASGIGIVMGALLLGGTASALISLFGRTGSSHRYQTKLQSLIEHRKDDVVEVHLQPPATWPGHNSGQFAFLTFDPSEGAHPFTISSAWSAGSDISFHIKRLGDFTKTLPEGLTVGQSVTIEGPYGRFEFTPTHADQIWVGAGVGLTPFIARLQALGDAPQPNQIHFYYCTRHADTQMTLGIENLCKKVGVRFTCVVSGRDKPLTGERMRQENPFWQHAHIWFCGPAALGLALRKDLMRKGLHSNHFHQELFEMR
jgi:predicted ferric reductase